MSFAGHVIDMLKRQNSNRAMRTSQRKGGKEHHGASSSQKIFNQDFKREISSEERAAITAAISKNKKRDRIRMITLGLIAMCIISLIVIVVYLAVFG